METVLLCGGAGFIGSHIAEAYIKEGYRVVVLDDLSTGNEENISGLAGEKDFIFIKGSMLDKEILEAIFEKYHPTIINNHAAQKSVPDSVIDPIKDNELNIVGLLNLIEMTSKYPIRTFLCASSGGALSKEILFDGDTSKEEDLPQFTSPYALTKYAGEQYLKIYAKINNFNYIGLRYANVFGPRQVAEGDCGVVPIFAENILNNRKSKLMTYDDMPRGCTRDYIYVRDVVAFNMLATKHTEHVVDVFNLGIGQEFAMLDLYEKLVEVFDVESNIEIVGPRLGDLRRSILTSEKAKEIFDWETKYDIHDGMEELRESYLK